MPAPSAARRPVPDFVGVVGDDGIGDVEESVALGAEAPGEAFAARCPGGVLYSLAFRTPSPTRRRRRSMRARSRSRSRSWEPRPPSIGPRPFEARWPAGFLLEAALSPGRGVAAEPALEAVS